MGNRSVVYTSFAARNLLICILVENLLPDIKKQTEDNVVGCVRNLHTIQIPTQFFEEWKNKLYLSYKSSFYKNRNVALETVQSPPRLFIYIPNLPYSSQKVCRCWKWSGFREQNFSWCKFHSFPVPFERCGEKWGHILNLKHSEETCVAALANSESKSNT